jgi:hypothetical protein
LGDSKKYIIGLSYATNNNNNNNNKNSINFLLLGVGSTKHEFFTPIKTTNIIFSPAALLPFVLVNFDTNIIFFFRNVDFFLNFRVFFSK